MLEGKSKYAIRLWYFRNLSNISQQELADKAGCSQAIIAKIESGTRTLSIDQAIPIAKALNITLDTFLAEEITITI